MPRSSKLAGIVLAFALLAAACSSDSGDEAATATSEPSVPSSTTAPATTATTAPATTAAPATTTAPEIAVPAATCIGLAPGEQATTLTSGGNDYALRIFVPSGAADAATLPVVLNWHGLGSDGEQQAAFSQFELLAETEGFLVASPTGFPSADDEQARNSWELPQFDVEGRDDVAFASELIDVLIANYCADESRVYSAGMSNGGLFTSQLVCQLGDRIAAAVSVAGVTHPEACTVSRGVPFLAFHGTEDDVVPYDGTQVTSSLLDEEDSVGAEFFAQVMPDEFAEIAVDMGCDADPTFSELGDDIRVHEYTGCLDDAPLRFYEVIGAGHTWPGSPFADILEERGLGGTTQNFDATGDTWAFFEEHSLDG